MSLYFQGGKRRQETTSDELERNFPSNDESINLGGGAFQQHGPEDEDFSHKLDKILEGWETDESLEEEIENESQVFEVQQAEDDDSDQED